MSEQELIQGSDEFKAAFTETPAPEVETPTSPVQIPLTVDSKGNIVGGTEGLPQEQIDQLNSPESQARIKRLYRDYHYGNTPPPRHRPIHESVAEIAGHKIPIPPRDLRRHNPPGLPSREGRKLRRQLYRKLQKIENQSGIFRKEVQDHGRQRADESNAGNGGASLTESSGIDAGQTDHDGECAPKLYAGGIVRPDGADSIHADADNACGAQETLTEGIAST